jgi:hypothetical protein
MPGTHRPVIGDGQTRVEMGLLSKVVVLGARLRATLAIDEFDPRHPLVTGETVHRDGESTCGPVTAAGVSGVGDAAGAATRGVVAHR